MEFTPVSSSSVLALGLTAALAVIVPIVIALVWKFRKKERFTTVLVGAGVFILFVFILEKPIQNVLLFPTSLGLSETGLSAFMTAHPILLSLLAGLFPGVFEETGRLVAFKTILKKRTNRETSISYGIGHGGIEVIILVGMTYAMYFMYALMINTGTYAKIYEQTAALVPDQADQLIVLADQLAAFGFVDLGLVSVERIFAVLFHIAASILVFYACRDREKFLLYPVAILLHTAMDFIAALYLFEVIHISNIALEVIIGIFSVAVFCGAYLLVYRKDKIA
jgi:uncharacterized membrane protein YhfC